MYYRVYLSWARISNEIADIFQVSDRPTTLCDMSQVPSGTALLLLLPLPLSLSQTDLIWSVDRSGAETMTVTAEFAARARRPSRIQGMSKLTQKSELFVSAKVKLLAMLAVEPELEFIVHNV